MDARGDAADGMVTALAEAVLDPARFRALADALPIGAVLVDEPGRIAYANDAWRQTTGYQGPLPLDFDQAFALVHPDDRDDLLHGLLHGLEDDGRFVGRCRTVRAPGEVRWVDLRATALPQPDGVWTGFAGTMHDVTELVAAEERTRRSEQRYRDLIEHSPVGQAIFDADGAVLQANRAYGELYGIAPADLRGVRTLALVHPDDRRAIAGELKAAMEGATGLVRATLRVQRSDGTWRWIDSVGSTISDHGDGARWTVAVVDVTERREEQERLRELAAIVETTSDLVGTIEPVTGEVLYLNPAARVVLGHPDEAHLTVMQLYTRDSMRRYAEEVLEEISAGRTWNGELEMRRRDGTTAQVWQTIHAERDAMGTVTRVSAVGRDVTARRQAEAHLAWQATHDALTELPNRSVLLAELERTLEDRSTAVAVMFLDLDRFKSINDTLGHDAGDELLVQVADRIRAVVRPEDLVARLGGDEFVVLCTDVPDDEHARGVAQRVLDVIEHEPFVIDSVELGMSASLGIARSSTGEHAEALLRDADAAMYRAKENGRARLELFDEVMRRRSSGRIDLAEQLSDAIEEGQITVLYQPIVDLVSGAPEGVEALARWQHPERGLLTPYEFIGLAEDTGLIVGLGLSVLEQACVQARRWIDLLGDRAPQVHINLSARQLSQTNLPLLVGGVLDKVGVPASALCLEITESVLMEDARAATKVLGDLKGIGLDLAIDDFGTGYSSLSYLRRFPVDVLKVDRTFIDGLGADPEDTAIVAAVVNLAHTLDLRAVAEGVETEAQLAELRSLGCDGAQGYLFSRPAPADQLEQLLLAPDRTIQPGA